jgi:small subunit ribosomal protein S16
LVKIRLRRTGKKKQPSYRIVVADSRMPRDGRYIESLGFYDPMTEPSTIRIDPERALYWLQQGAQPTRQVQNLMKIEGIWDRFKIPKTSGGAGDERTTGVSGEGTG